MNGLTEGERRLPKALAQVGGAIAAGLGFIALIGWVLGLPFLSSFGSALIPMAPSTALMFIVLGGASFLYLLLPMSNRARRVGLSLSWLAALVALLLLFFSLMGIRLKAEHLGLPITGTVAGAPVGYMSPVTAFSFVAAGLSFVASLSSRADRPRRARTALGFASLIIVINCVFTFAYFVRLPLLYGGGFIPPAYPTSLAFVALGLALLAIARTRAAPTSDSFERPYRQASQALLLTFFILALGIVTTGYLYFRNYESKYRVEVEHQLSAIAELKVSEISHWRGERLGDGSLLYDNPGFTNLVRRVLEKTGDEEGQEELRVWLSRALLNSEYDRVFLVDVQGVEQMSVPDMLEPVAPHLSDDISKVLRSPQVEFVDLHRDVQGRAIHMDVLVPIQEELNSGRVIGILVLRIDPEKYLYPLVNRWPTPSQTAETLIVRRDGNEALFLSELKFEPQTALELRIPLDRVDVAAVKAVQGQTGIVEAVDYRGVRVLADLRAIPQSPWFMVARIDLAEVLAPVRARVWEMVVLVGALVFGAGTGVGVIWRQQRIRFYRERYGLANERAWLQEVIARSLNEVYVLDPQSLRFTFANAGACVNLGYAVEDIADLTLPDVMPAFTQESFHTLLSPIHTGERKLQVFETVHRRRDGSEYPVEVHLQEVETGGGPVLLAVSSDITERKRAEKIVRESEEKYRLIADNADDWIYLVAPDRKMHYTSPSCERATGYTPAEFTADPGLLARIIHPDDRQNTESHFADAREAADAQNLEFRIVTKTGETRWINHSCVPVYTDEGQYAGRRGTNRDITARKQAETALRESEEHYRSLFRNMLHGFAACRVLFENGRPIDFVYLDVNDVFEKLTGLKDVVGRQVSEVIPGIHESNPELLEIYSKVAMTGEPDRFETYVPALGIWFSISVYRPMQDHFVALFDNITERKRAEESLQQTLADLERSNKELEQFAYVASHDLQEPLRMVSGYTQLLARRYKGRLDTDADEFIAYAVDGAKRMEQLISDLLAFSRVGTRGNEFAPTECEVVLGRALANLRASLEETRAEVTHEPLPSVSADEAQLVQMMQNLLSNALKFRGDGPPRVHLAAERRGNEWLFSVHDSGIGFDADEYGERIFIIFQRLQGRVEYPGTGIGLAICKKIVERHGGRIWAESKPGQGATFYFTLPANEGDQP